MNMRIPVKREHLFRFDRNPYASTFADKSRSSILSRRISLRRTGEFLFVTVKHTFSVVVCNFYVIWSVACPKKHKCHFA